jgi:hypothetical protein
MAGSTTVTHYTLGYVRRLVVDWVADAADGTIPDTVMPRFEGRLFELHTNPGATAPTDNYDITLVDAEGIDRLQGVGVDRDTANTEQAIVVFPASTIHPVVSRSDVLTLKFAGQAVHSATGRVILVYGPA